MGVSLLPVYGSACNSFFVIVNLVLLGRLSHLLLSDSIIQLVYMDVVEMEDGPYRHFYKTLEKLHSSF